MMRCGWIVGWLWVCGVSLAAAEVRVRVLTSFLPAYCFTANVAGTEATVENLLPGGVSPHDYQLSTSDLRKITQADLIIVNGLGLESFLDRALRNAGEDASKKMAVMTRGMESQLIPLHAASSGTTQPWNPHVWLDPRMAAGCVSNILEALQRADPPHAAAYARNAAAFLKRLEALDTDLRAELAPVQKTAFVTYHNAFAYFVRRYGLTLAGVVEKTPDVTPSARELNVLIATIRKEKVKALFTEPASSARMARQIARDTGIAAAQLDPLETGKLDPSTYETVMRQNGRTLVQTLK